MRGHAHGKRLNAFPPTVKGSLASDYSLDFISLGSVYFVLFGSFCLVRFVYFVWFVLFGYFVLLRLPVREGAPTPFAALPSLWYGASVACRFPSPIVCTLVRRVRNVHSYPLLLSDFYVTEGITVDAPSLWGVYRSVSERSALLRRGKHP